jgi:hypothetical protein
MVIEVIVTNPESGSEFSRLYLDSDKLVSKINFQHFNMTFLIKLQAARRNKLSFCAEDVGSQIIGSMTVTMILDRLEIRRVCEKDGLEAYLNPTICDKSNSDVCHQLDYQYPGLPQGVEPFRMPMVKLNLFMPKMRPDDVKPEVSTPSTVHSACSSDTADNSNSDCVGISHKSHSMLSLQHSEKKRKGSFFDRFSFMKSNRNQIAPLEYSSKDSETSHPNDDDGSDVNNTTSQKVRIKPGATNSLRNVFIA